MNIPRILNSHRMGTVYRQGTVCMAQQKLRGQQASSSQAAPCSPVVYVQDMLILPRRQKVRGARGIAVHAAEMFELLEE